MSNPIDRLAEIAARIEAAAAGPWKADGAEIYGAPHGHIDIEQWVAESLDIDDEKASNSNAAFIAHAREDIPFLLQLLREKDAEIAELQAKLAIRERQLDDMDAAVIA